MNALVYKKSGFTRDWIVETEHFWTEQYMQYQIINQKNKQVKFPFLRLA